VVKARKSVRGAPAAEALFRKCRDTQRNALRNRGDLPQRLLPCAVAEDKGRLCYPADVWVPTISRIDYPEGAGDVVVVFVVSVENSHVLLGCASDVSNRAVKQSNFSGNNEFCFSKDEVVVFCP